MDVDGKRSLRMRALPVRGLVDSARLGAGVRRLEEVRLDLGLRLIRVEKRDGIGERRIDDPARRRGGPRQR